MVHVRSFTEGLTRLNQAAIDYNGAPEDATKRAFDFAMRALLDFAGPSIWSFEERGIRLNGITVHAMEATGWGAAPPHPAPERGRVLPYTGQPLVNALHRHARCLVLDDIPAAYALVLSCDISECEGDDDECATVQVVRVIGEGGETLMDHYALHRQHGPLAEEVEALLSWAAERDSSEEWRLGLPIVFPMRRGQHLPDGA